MTDVEAHANWLTSFLKDFGETIIRLEIDNSEDLDTLIDIVEKTYIDTGEHFLKHGKEANNNE